MGGCAHAHVFASRSKMVRTAFRNTPFSVLTARISEVYLVAAGVQLNLSSRVLLIFEYSLINVENDHCIRVLSF